TVSSLQWYRQNLNTKPEFLLSVTEYSNKSEPALHLYSHAVKLLNHVYLEISSVSLSDSDLYYCAMVPTVTQNTTTLNKNLKHNTASVAYKYKLYCC
ncbi:MAG: hypothetical protein ACRC7H_07110, partial [Plesiomonas shigelloides]